MSFSISLVRIFCSSVTSEALISDLSARFFFSSDGSGRDVITIVVSLSDNLGVRSMSSACASTCPSIFLLLSFTLTFLLVSLLSLRSRRCCKDIATSSRSGNSGSFGPGTSCPISSLSSSSSSVSSTLPSSCSCLVAVTVSLSLGFRSKRLEPSASFLLSSSFSFSLIFLKAFVLDFLLRRFFALSACSSASASSSSPSSHEY
mmetsp:Transcript_28615/g.39887  ORF Transcript_28615/g.39887 Transcript_28615/m.39887 type:complete len:203 (-) Transcript_28615:232-840(-)